MMKRTEKSKANSRQEKSIANSRQKRMANSRQKSIANSRQEKSIANSRQKSRANSRQSKPKDCDRFKAKHEEKHSKLQGKAQYKARVRQPASTQKHLRTDANVQQGKQGQKELKLEEGIAKIPEIDFNEEIVEYKRIIQAAQQPKTATTS